MKLFSCRRIEEKDALEPFLPSPDADPNNKTSPPATVTEVSELYCYMYLLIPCTNYNVDLSL